jgi:hypothetical protein
LTSFHQPGSCCPRRGVRRGGGGSVHTGERPCRCCCSVATPQAGIPPSLRVLDQLDQKVMSLAHAKLGRRGAGPLAAALASNTAVASLDLSDNDFDALVSHCRLSMKDTAGIMRAVLVPRVPCG